MLQRAIRDHAEKIDEQEMRHAVLRLTRQIELLDGNHSLDELRGLEGDSAHIYFDVFDHLIVAQKGCIPFR